MLRFFSILIAVCALAFISACGGGGGGGGSGSGSGSGSGGGVDPNISSPSSGTELVSAIDISNIESIGLVSQSASIALMDKVKDFFYGVFSIKTAYAVQNNCASNLKKLVGIDSSRNKKEFNLTSSLTSSGLCELADVGNYLVTTNYGIYKNKKLCNLVLIRKTDGKLFCYQEDIPANYSLSVSNNFYGNLQITPNQDYAYLLVSSGVASSDAQRAGAYTQSIKLFRFDLSTSTPLVDVIADYDSTNYTAILGFKALNNGSIVIGRMEPSTSSDALSDGYLRLLEYWSFQRVNNSTSKSVSVVDYIVTPTGGTRNLNFNCFLDYGANDDDAMLAMYGNTAGYRSTLWKIPKPASPTASTTPVRLTNEGASRLCWGSYPFYHGGKVYSLWQNQNGNVDLVETTYAGNETTSLLYNTGNTQGAWSSSFGKLYRTKDFLLIPKMNYGQADSLIATALDTTGVASPINLMTVFGTSLGLKIVEVSSSSANNTFTVTSDAASGNGDRIITKCKYRSASSDFNCTEQSRESSSSDLASTKFYSANSQ
jgi:hypothetical protein